ncbi:hypothetical protein CN545_29955 [Bacillus toyonensis]|nr:hypothetical protein CN545_29955 [Bacillus toyonensis]
MGLLVQEFETHPPQLSDTGAPIEGKGRLSTQTQSHSKTWRLWLVNNLNEKPSLMIEFSLVRRFFHLRVNYNSVL